MKGKMTKAEMAERDTLEKLKYELYGSSFSEVFRSHSIPVEMVEKYSGSYAALRSLAEWVEKRLPLSEFEEYAFLPDAAGARKAEMSIEEAKRWMRNGRFPYDIWMWREAGIPPEFYYEIRYLTENLEKIKPYLEAARELGLV